MPTIAINETDIRYLLITYDRQGVERSDDPEGRMSDLAVAAARQDVTDVFLVSHGWKGDIPGARDQFGLWIQTMAACTVDLARARQVRPGFKPLILGLHWPSQPWGDEGLASAVPGFGIDAGESPVKNLVDIYAERLTDTPKARAALETILTYAAENMAPSEMPREVADAYLALDRETEMGSGNLGGDPGSDREPFDPIRAYKAAMRNESEFGGISLGGILSPLRQLSFWIMKNRGRTFGETGGSELLRHLQASAPRARFHLMGHSFGCVVMSSILAGKNGNTPLPRPVDTLFLVQGAMSFWSYCADIPQQPGTPGYFRSVVRDGKVRGPILATTSEHDTAVGTIYPLAAGIAGQVAFDVVGGTVVFPKYGGLGAFGLRGPGIDIVDRAMLPADGNYDFAPGKVYNLQASRYIAKMDGSSGAHNDIAHPEVAHAFWQAVMV